MNFVGPKVIGHNLWFINCLLTLRVWLAGKSWEVVKRCKTPSNGSRSGRCSLSSFWKKARVANRVSVCLFCCCLPLLLFEQRICRWMNRGGLDQVLLLPRLPRFRKSSFCIITILTHQLNILISIRSCCFRRKGIYINLISSSREERPCRSRLRVVMWSK